MILNIADLYIQIECSNKYYLLKLKENYKPFITKKNIKPIFKIKINFDNNHLKNNSFQKDESIIKICRNDNYKISKSNQEIMFMNFNNQYSYLRFYKNKNLAVLDLNEEINLVILDFILKLIFKYILIKNEGYEIHASAVIKNKKGYLFFGPSGAGKSTIANSFSDGKVIHDDRVIIKKFDNKIKIYNVIDHNFPKLDKPVELDSIFRIIQHEKNKLIKRSKNYILKHLVQEQMKINYLLRKEIDSNKLSKILKNLISPVNTYELYFRKKCDFWGLIDAIR